MAIIYLKLTLAYIVNGIHDCPAKFYDCFSDFLALCHLVEEEICNVKKEISYDSEFLYTSYMINILILKGLYTV